MYHKLFLSIGPFVRVVRSGVCEGRVGVDHDELEDSCRVSNIEQSADDDNYNFLSEPVSDD